MKYILLLLSLLPVVVQAEPFNINLPVNLDYSPGVLKKAEKSVWLGVNQEYKNFQLQVRMQNGVEHFLDDETGGTGFGYGFSYGIWNGLEVSISGNNDTGNLALQYDFDRGQSRWQHSAVVAYLTGTSYGHSGTVLSDDDCSFLDLFCILDLGSLFCLFDCNTDTYEYYYEANTSGGLLAYIQGYRVTPEFVPYWGLYAMSYNIKYSVHDNVDGSETATGKLTTDMAAIVLGAKWHFAKEAENKTPMSLVLNYVLISESQQHDGNIDGDLRLLLKVIF